MQEKIIAIGILICLIAANFITLSVTSMKMYSLTITKGKTGLNNKNKRLSEITLIGNGKIIYVDDDAEPGGNGSKERPYNRIQDAINAASNGDTIYVYSGKYYENVILKKSVSLIGEDKYTTIIDGNGKGIVIWIKVSHVNVSGFTVTGSKAGEWPTSYYGIQVLSQQWYEPPLPKRLTNIHISNCTIEDNEVGLRLYTTSNSSVKNCEIKDNDHSFLVYESSHNITVTNCYIHHGGDGIHCWGFKGYIDGKYRNNFCSNISITYCNISYNHCEGIYIENCKNVKIHCNNIHDNGYVGIDVRSSSHVNARFNWWGDTVWQDFFYFLGNKKFFKVRFSYFFPWRMVPVQEAGIKN